MPRSAALTARLGRHHLGERRLLEALAPLRLQPRRVQDDEARLVPPHRDVGDVVLQDLELADLAAERLSLLHVGERVLEDAVEDAAAEAGEDDPLVVQRRQQHAPRLAGLAEDEVVRDEDVVETHVAGSDRAHAELRQLGDLHAVGAVGTRNRVRPWWRFADVVVACARAAGCSRPRAPTSTRSCCR